MSGASTQVSRWLDALLIMLLVIALGLTLQRMTTDKAGGRFYQEGDAIPALSYANDSGEVYRLSDIDGRWALIVFSACTSCFAEIPFWSRLQTILTNTGNRDSKVIGLFLEPIPTLNAFRSRTAIGFQVLLDPTGKAASDLRIKATSTVFLVDNGYIMGMYINPSLKTRTRAEVLDFFSVTEQQLRDVARR